LQKQNRPGKKLLDKEKISSEQSKGGYPRGKRRAAKEKEKTLLLSGRGGGSNRPIVGFFYFV